MLRFDVVFDVVLTLSADFVWRPSDDPLELMLCFASAISLTCRWTSVRQPFDGLPELMLCFASAVVFDGSIAIVSAAFLSSCYALLRCRLWFSVPELMLCFASLRRPSSLQRRRPSSLRRSRVDTLATVFGGSAFPS